MSNHPVVSEQVWISARKELLAREKEISRLCDDLAKLRRELPWVKVTKPYIFKGPDGQQSLSDLFFNRSQLIVYHFMFDPDWTEGCPICSFWADNYDRSHIHLAHRDATLVTISRAPYEKIKDYQQRLGWTFPWFSSEDSDFNFDFQVSISPEQVKSGNAEYNYQKTKMSGELPGISVFFRDETGDVFHTYSAYSRGLDMLNGTYHFMDLLPKGRDEEGLPWTMAWVRRHDQYED